MLKQGFLKMVICYLHFFIEFYLQELLNLGLNHKNIILKVSIPKQPHSESAFSLVKS